MKKRIQELNNEQKKNLFSNNKGFSLVELCATVAIMVTLIAVITGSVSTIYKARAKSAAEKIGSVISQSKINSLSGIDNEFALSYDADKKQYVCTLTKYTIDASGTITYEQPYKTELVGSSRVSISAEGKSVLDGAVLKIRFSNNDGRVEAISITEGDSTTSLDDKTSNVISVSSSKTYEITLYNLTGEHEIKLV